MGMYCSVYTVADVTLARLCAEPALVWSLIAPDDQELLAVAREPSARPGWLGRLFGRGATASASAPSPLALTADEGLAASLDKAWHGLHFLLTGTAWEGAPPLHFLVAGGREIEHPSLDGQTVRTFTAARTREIAAALATLTTADLRARFDPAAMTALDIYPTIWHRALDPTSDDDPLDYCLEYFDRLRTALPKAAATSHGVLVHIG